MEKLATEIQRKTRQAIRAHDWIPAATIPPNLPLLDELRRSRLRNNLAGWDVLMIQHHLGTFMPLVQALLADGMDTAHSWHVDIPYSTNHHVNTMLRTTWNGDGQIPPLFTDPLTEYSEAQELRTSLSILRILQTRQQRRRLLVIDDGAHFTRSVLALERIGALEAHTIHGTAVVEQTTRGHRFLEHHHDDLKRLHIPVISIARTASKRMIEGPFIGASVVRAIANRVLERKNIAVLGYGVIGAATARSLICTFPRASLTIVEKDPSLATDAARSSRGRWHATENLDHHLELDLVVGCTGTKAFRLEDRRLLADGAVLASGSSAALEFDRQGFVELADHYPDDDVRIVDREKTRASGIHADIAIALEGNRVITFLNAGFPINFDGSVESLPVHMIQATRCLLYAAAQQATTTQPAGLTALHRDVDRWILQNALTYL